MSDMLDIFALAPLGPAILGWTVFGIVWQALATLLFARSARLHGQAADEIEALAAEGQPQRARIRAREAPRDLAPLLSTLSGEASPRLSPPSQPTVLAVVALALPMTVVVFASFLSPPPRTSLALATATAALLPGSLIGARAVLLVGRRSARRIRAACVRLLEENARAEVERGRSAALRRRFEEGREP